MRRSLAVLVSCLFLCSGAIALVYQVAWSRDLALVFGVSHQAVAIVLAAFMGGLALGGFSLGRVAERLQRPLRVYGLLELAVGAAALLLPLLLALVERIYVGIALRRDGVDLWLHLTRAAMAFTVLVIPTFFMGGTLPVLTRFVVHRREDFGARLAWLYGINTFGAVLGAVTAGFVLLPAIGVRRTQFVAIAANAAVAALALLADRRLRTGASAADAVLPADAAPETPAVPLPVLETSPPSSLTLAFYGTFVSGLCALALEVMWTRALGIAIGTTTYAFTIMLAAFLTGITLGSILHGLFPLRRLALAAQCGLALAAIGASSAVVSQLVPGLPQLAVELNARLHGGAVGMRVAATLLLSFAVMLVPATCMGIAFPLAGRARAALRPGFGRSVGDLVGLNTLGGILGPLLAGFVLIPLLGLQKGMLLICALDLGYGLLVLAVFLGARQPRRRALAVLGGVVAVAASLALPYALPAWDLHTLGSFQNNVTVGYTNASGRIDVRGQLAATQRLYYREGRGATVSVIEAQQFRAVVINGRSVATDHHSDLHHEYLLGHVPVLLHPHPKTALVIGLGAGLTLGGVTAHPELQEITLVEIEPAVLGAARVFSDLNGNALDDPRLHIVVQDGRNYLRTTARQFDVITADPIHPYEHGSAYLFTSEYYALTAAHLAPGGILCQWMPLYELTEDNLRSIVASLSAHFAHNLLFQTAFDAVLIASNAPLQVDATELAKRLHQTEVHRQLERVGLADPISFLCDLTMDDASVRRFAAGARLSTDDNLYLEFSSPLAIGRPDGGANVRLVDSFRTGPRPLVTHWGKLADSTVDSILARTLWAKRETVEITAQIEECLLTPGAAVWDPVIARLQVAHATAPHYGRPRVQLAEALTGRGRAEREAGDLAAAERSFRAALEVVPTDAHARFQLAAVLTEQGRPAEALPEARRTLALRSGYPRGLQLLGSTLLALGRPEEAVAALHEATLQEPENARAHFDLAVALTRTGKLERAAQEYEAALHFDRRLSAAYYNLAVVLEAQKRDADAVRVLRHGLRAVPDDEMVGQRLAWILATSSDAGLRDGDEAVDIAAHLVARARERLPEALVTQAAALAEAGRFDEAITAARRAAELAGERQDAGLVAQIRDHLRLYEARSPLRL